MENSNQSTDDSIYRISNVNNLLNEFHKEKILYCHWKSSEHLTKSVQGLTDLDILIDHCDAQKVFGILSKLNYKRFLVPKGRSYHAIEDYLSLDYESGKVVHLHLHYKLIVGEKHLKGYRLPLEHFILSTRRFDKVHGIYTIDLNLELILLLVRSALKLRIRDIPLNAIGRSPIQWGTLREFNWLKERVDYNVVEDICKKIFNEEATRVVFRIIEEGPSIKNLLKFKKVIRPSIRYTRTYNWLFAGFLRRKREGMRVLDVINKKIFKLSIPFRRTIPTGGRSIVLMGPDGSGKSTLIKELNGWLSKNFDVKSIYMGSGDGESSLIRGPLRAAYKTIQKIKVMQHRGKSMVANSERNIAFQEKNTGRFIRNIGKIPWAISLAYERKVKIKKSIRATNRGMIVIMDRYPQNQIKEGPDSPKLGKYLLGKNKVLKRLATWEYKAYDLAKVCPPDLVIKLQVTPSVAVQRKPGEFTEEMSEKLTKAINSVDFSERTKVIHLNVDGSLEQVIGDLKKNVWDCI